MKVNVKLNNAVFYDVTRFSIRLGEAFEIVLDTPNTTAQWFSNNDPALYIKVADDNRSAKIEAREKGDCQIQFQASIGTVTKAIDIEIYDNVAVGLGLSAGDPELK